MRSISANGLTKLATNLGTEPIVIIEIQWVDGGPRASYSDRDLTNVKGKIIQISTLDDVVQTSGNTKSQQVTVTLDDVDGALKSIIDNNDIHKRPCWVYQWFDGLDLSDKFLLFAGQVNTPIVWNEGDRTITFDVISKIEDAEIGFSIEEGDFVDPPKQLIGQAWPLCFGTVINAPALMLSTPRQGTLATGVGISDWTLPAKAAAARKLLCATQFLGYDFVYQATGTHDYGGPSGGAEIFPLWGDEPGCAESRCQQIATIDGQLAAQQAYEFSVIRIFNGDNFPQGVPLRLNISGAIFTGSFSGELFTITSRIHPDLANPLVKTSLDTVIDVTNCHQTAAVYQVQNFSADNPGPSSDAIKASQDAFNAIPSSNFFWANAGATVTLDTDQVVIYIANILPSTILRVAAFRDTDAGSVLVTVPPEAYTIRQVDYTGYQVMELVFGRPLSSLGVGWSDNVYVTLTSSVGPNTVDILKWFIQTYTAYAIDDTSFNHVHDLIDNYPSHFMMPGRMNIIDALDQISYQARCAVWLADGVFHIKYLPEEPTPVDTIIEDDVIASSLELSHTRTEDLITKYIATWQPDYSVPDKDIIIYRHNVKKYGTIEQTYDFYIYNILDLVRKSATFWLIRKANTWRQVSFKAPLNKLNLEIFDSVSLELSDVSGQTIKAEIQQATYDPASNTIDFQCWTPLRSGETTPYVFAWPADVSETLIFPTPAELTSGFAGGNNGPNFVVKAPPNHPLSNTLIQGFQLACNGGAVEFGGEDGNPICHADFGLRKPSDRGDTKKTPRASTDNSNIGGTYNPLAPALGGGANSCCDTAKNLAQKALDAANEAKAMASSGDGGSNDGGSNPNSNRKANKKNLPKKADKQKDGKCVYSTKVSYVTVNQVHGINGKLYDITNPDGSIGHTSSSVRPGDTGGVSTSTPAGDESTGFDTMAGAQAFAAGVQAEIDSRNNTGGWVVGQRQALLVFPPLGADPVPPGSPPCIPPDTSHGSDGTPPKMVSFDSTP